jgi:hypothetical protein
MLGEVMRFWVITALMLATTAPARAADDEPKLGIAAEANGGIEGAVDGPDAGVRRTRTTLLAGPEGSAWSQLLALLLRVEVEPDASIGAEIRYGYRVIEPLVIQVNAAGVFYPETLVGAGLGLAYRPRLSDLVELGIGPSGQVFFAGSDLPEEVPVIWQAVVAASIHIWP